MKYLLDTDTLIDFLEDRYEIRPQINTMIQAGDEVALCAITVGELYSGLDTQKRVKWEEWLRALPYRQISREAAEQAGILRRTAAEAGRTLHVSDCLIAACARQQGAIVLTSNKKDFEKMKDIRLMSLRKKASS